MAPFWAFYCPYTGENDLTGSLRFNKNETCVHLHPWDRPCPSCEVEKFQCIGIKHLKIVLSKHFDTVLLNLSESPKLSAVESNDIDSRAKQADNLHATPHTKITGHPWRWVDATMHYCRHHERSSKQCEAADEERCPYGRPTSRDLNTPPARAPP